MIYLIMGVAGSGKTTIGTLPAEKLGCSLLESDNLHSEQNRAKMSSGIPLTDDDRRGWIEQINQLMRSSNKNLVVVCSALKAKVQTKSFKGVSKYKLVFLDADRTSHFFPESLAVHSGGFPLCKGGLRGIFLVKLGLIGK